MRPVDVLTPFMNANSNRSEFFLVPISGFLYNRTAAFVMNMLRNPNRWINDYPDLKIFYDLTPLQIYEATKYFDVIDMLTTIIDPRHIQGNNVNYELIANTLKELDSMDMKYKLVTPLIAYALSQIAIERCCNKIYVIKDIPFSKHEEDYLRKLFSESTNKIELISGDCFTIWSKYKDSLTTIFINNLSDLDPIADYIIDNNYPEFINNQLFILKLTKNIFTIDDTTGLIRYTCTDQIKDLKELRIHTSILNPDPYPIMDKGIPVHSSKKKI